MAKLVQKKAKISRSEEVITRKNESKNKEPLEYIAAEVVKMDCPSSQSKKVLSKKPQSEKKEKHEDITEVLGTIRKSNRKRKVNQSDCYIYY